MEKFFAKIILETEGFSEIDASGMFGTALEIINREINREKNQTPLSEIKEKLEEKTERSWR